MEFIVYFIESGICLLVFYFFYTLLLRKENSFGHNRIYLLITPLIALIIPFITIPFYYYKYKPLPEPYSLLSIPFEGTAFDDMGGIPFNWQGLIIVVYTLGFSFLLVRFILQLFKIKKSIKSGENNVGGLNREDLIGIRIVHGEKSSSTFSFLKTIFLGDSIILSKEEIDQVIIHEIAHIQQKHSYDSIYFHILTIILWFNPVIWWYKSAISVTHEYLADRHVINSNDKDGYVKLLIKQIFAESGFSTVSPFAESKTIKRIEMMKLRTYISDKSRFFLLIPLFITLLAIFSFEITEMNIDPSNTSHPILIDNEIDITITKSQDSIEFVLIEDDAISARFNFLNVNIRSLNSKRKMKKALKFITMLKDHLNYSSQSLSSATHYQADIFPEFVGGLDQWSAYISQNLEYPRTKATGKVFVEFIVTKEGLIRDTRVLKGIGVNYDEEAKKVVSRSPKWIPGELDGEKVDVKMVVPIDFRN